MRVDVNDVGSECEATCEGRPVVQSHGFSGAQ